MEFIDKGNYTQAIEELKQDTNNAVASVFETNNSNKGKLSNVIFTLKNNYAKNFDSTDASSDILIDFNPGYNATILDLILAQGAQLVATTNLDEFGLGGTGQYSNRGLILNPLNKDYLVGGSSSGAAATFTKNIGFAIGSDTGDSVRLPASNIGAIGFKPSYGAVSRYGLFSYSSSLDTVAWFTHNVNDSYVLAQILYQKDFKDLTSIKLNLSESISEEKPKTIAYLDCFDYLEPYIKEAYSNLIKKLESQGIELIKISINKQLLDAIKVVYSIISFSEASSNLSNLTGVGFAQRQDGNSWEEIFKNTRSKGFGFMVQRRLALGSFYLEKENQEELFKRAQKVRRLISDWFNQIYDQYQFLIYPASASIAPLKDKLDEFSSSTFMSYILTSSNLVGNPSMTMNMGYYNSMPFSIALETKIYNDEKLFSFALFLEKILGAKND